MTNDHKTYVEALVDWFVAHAITRKYGEVGIVITKHDGHIVKIRRIDEERPEKGE